MHNIFIILFFSILAVVYYPDGVHIFVRLISHFFSPCQSAPVRFGYFDLTKKFKYIPDHVKAVPCDAHSGDNIEIATSTAEQKSQTLTCPFIYVNFSALILVIGI